jgi:hypothetical protein
VSKVVKNILVASVIVAVVAAVAGGLILLGSPAKERMRRLDERRVNDLQAISSRVNLYWTRHKSLPSSLLELSREPGIAVNTTDPETGQPFEYKAVNDKNYDLCAQFDHDMAEDQDTLIKDFWTHGSGRQCFHFRVTETKR